MRGVIREERSKVEEMLRSGKAPMVISRELNIPLSTITTWLKQLRKDKKENIVFSSQRIKSIYTAKTTNSKEAQIMNIIQPYLMDDMTDNEFFFLENQIAKVLKTIADEIL